MTRSFLFPLEEPFSAHVAAEEASRATVGAELEQLLRMPPRPTQTHRRERGHSTSERRSRARRDR